MSILIICFKIRNLKIKINSYTLIPRNRTIQNIPHNNAKRTKMLFTSFTLTKNPKNVLDIIFNKY